MFSCLDVETKIRGFMIFFCDKNFILIKDETPATLEIKLKKLVFKVKK